MATSETVTVEPIVSNMTYTNHAAKRGLSDSFMWSLFASCHATVTKHDPTNPAAPAAAAHAGVDGHSTAADNAAAAISATVAEMLHAKAKDTAVSRCFSLVRSANTLFRPAMNVTTGRDNKTTMVRIADVMAARIRYVFAAHFLAGSTMNIAWVPRLVVAQALILPFATACPHKDRNAVALVLLIIAGVLPQPYSAFADVVASAVAGERVWRMLSDECQTCGGPVRTASLAAALASCAVLQVIALSLVARRYSKAASE